MIEKQSSSLSTTIDNSRRKEVVKARWGILRNALLQNAQQHQQERQHSIHRFLGYNLLEARPANSNSSVSECESSLYRIESLLTEYRLDHSSKNNIDQLEIAILALAACFPKGKCMRIISSVGANNNSLNTAATTSLSDTWLESIKYRCQPSVRVWKVSEGLEDHGKATMMVTTLLVQESSSSTKYQVLSYALGKRSNNDDIKSLQNEKNKYTGNSSIVDGTHLSYRHIIWTREPRETRLSLDDLVSHRKNNGVDNTGNICVWDSERTLAYLLYHHFDDFFTQTASDNEIKNTIQVTGSNYDSIMLPKIKYNKNNPELRILELGTGMAGLSALALGIRLAIQHQEHGDKTSEDDVNETENREIKNKSIHVTLTDGNPSGVKNNAVNQYLTKLNSQMIWQEKGNYSHYLDLHVKCETLIWTTCLDSGMGSLINQDVVLVSDCVHFQNFHAALATTSLRCLRVGASAIFCQPTRGPSLDNFFNLLSTTSTDKDITGSTSLLSCKWLSHPSIEQKHHEARLQHKNVYDENLHQPKILVVTKLREVSEKDQTRFIAYQHRYSPIVPTTIEEKFR